MYLLGRSNRRGRPLPKPGNSNGFDCCCSSGSGVKGVTADDSSDLSEAGVENESSNMSFYPIRGHCSLFFRCSRAILSVAVVLISFNNAGGITISTGIGCLDPSLK